MPRNKKASIDTKSIASTESIVAKLPKEDRRVKFSEKLDVREYDNSHSGEVEYSKPRRRRSFKEVVTEYLEKIFDDIVIKHKLSEEHDGDTVAKASADLCIELRKLPRDVFTNIRNANYDISAFTPLMKDNLLIITGEQFMMTGDEMMKTIEYIKNKKIQAGELRATYDFPTYWTDAQNTSAILNL